MMTSAKTLLSLLRNNDNNIIKYEQVKFNSIYFKEDEELLSIIMRNVFFMVINSHLKN